MAASDDASTSPPQLSRRPMTDSEWLARLDTNWALGRSNASPDGTSLSGVALVAGIPQDPSKMTLMLKFKPPDDSIAPASSSSTSSSSSSSSYASSPTNSSSSSSSYASSSSSYASSSNSSPSSSSSYASSSHASSSSTSSSSTANMPESAEIKIAPKYNKAIQQNIKDYVGNLYVAPYGRKQELLKDGVVSDDTSPSEIERLFKEKEAGRSSVSDSWNGKGSFEEKKVVRDDVDWDYIPTPSVTYEPEIRRNKNRRSARTKGDDFADDLIEELNALESDLRTIDAVLRNLMTMVKGLHGTARRLRHQIGRHEPVSNSD